MKENSIYAGIGKIPLHSGFSQEDYWVWGSSVVKGDDGLYHMYVSRWPKRLPFFVSWMTDSEIAHAVSETAVGPYRFNDVALGKRGAQYWDGQSCHNPKIMRWGGKYILYYMGSTHPFEPLPDGKTFDFNGKHCVVGRSNKRIGVAVADSPYGPWERMDTPILPTKPNTFYAHLTSNPSPVIHEDGSVLLMFKGRPYAATGHGSMGIGVAKADHYLGPYRVMNTEPLFGEERFGVIEDPSIWFDDQGYHMLAKDMTGAICGEKLGGFQADSPDGLDWKPAANPLAYSRNVTWENGATTHLGHMERCFPLLENGKITTLFFAIMDEGQGEFDGSSSRNIAIPLQG